MIETGTILYLKEDYRRGDREYGIPRGTRARVVDRTTKGNFVIQFDGGAMWNDIDRCEVAMYFGLHLFDNHVPKPPYDYHSNRFNPAT